MPIAPAIGSALIGLAGSLGSSIASNRGALRRQRLADRENIRFWNMQNQYNHPLAQMQRLQKAGLNPNLIYGSSVAGATGSAGSIAPSKAAPYNIANPVPTTIAAALAPSQEAKNRADEIKTLADAKLTGKLARDRDLKIDAELKELNARADIARSTSILKDLEAQGMSSHKGEYFESLLAKFQTEKSRAIVEALNANIAEELKLRPNDPLWYRELKNLAKSIEDQIKSFKDLPRQVQEDLLNRFNPFKN
jgi:hypothetical protein